MIEYFLGDGSPWQIAFEHEVKHHADSPKITAKAVGIVFEGLGGHIDR